MRGTRPRVAKEAWPTRTISRAIAIRSADGSSKPRRPTRASSPVGTRVVPSGCARAPQPRCDDEGCAAGLAPRALLFAARSPMRARKITQISQENTCRSHAFLNALVAAAPYRVEIVLTHQWSKDGWAWSVDVR